MSYAEFDSSVFGIFTGIDDMQISIVCIPTGGYFAAVTFNSAVAFANFDFSVIRDAGFDFSFDSTRDFTFYIFDICE